VHSTARGGGGPHQHGHGTEATSSSRQAMNEKRTAGLTHGAVHGVAGEDVH